MNKDPRFVKEVDTENLNISEKGSLVIDQFPCCIFVFLLFTFSFCGALEPEVVFHPLGVETVVGAGPRQKINVSLFILSQPISALNHPPWSETLPLFLHGRNVLQMLCYNRK